MEDNLSEAKFNQSTEKQPIREKVRHSGRSFGFSEHVIIGRIVTLTSSEVDGNRVVNCRLAVSPWAKYKSPRPTTWYEVSLWDTQAYAFDRLRFKEGDQVLFRLDNIRVDAWIDHEGKPKAAIKGAVDKFVDLRPSQHDYRPLLQELEKEEKEPQEPSHLSVLVQSPDNTQSTEKDPIPQGSPVFRPKF
jgi:single-stranded DNA-binding protein